MSMCVYKYEYEYEYELQSNSLVRIRITNYGHELRTGQCIICIMYIIFMCIHYIYLGPIRYITRSIRAITYYIYITHNRTGFILKIYPLIIILLVWHWLLAT